MWRCIGCGRIEAQQPCIGICQDRKVDVVFGHDYDEVAARLEAARQEARAAIAMVRQLAWTPPREAEWEHSYRALQQQARELLARGSG